MFVLGLIIGILLSVFVWVLAKASGMASRAEEAWLDEIYGKGGWLDDKGMDKR